MHMIHTFIKKHTYIDTDWHDAHDEYLTLLQGHQPFIQDIRTVILADAYANTTTESHTFIAECFDKKHKTSEENPTILEFTLDGNDYKNRITCYWDNHDYFHIIKGCDVCDYYVYITYEIYKYNDIDIFYVPIASYYNGLKYGNSSDFLLTDKQFNTFEDAKQWLTNFQRNNPDFHANNISIHVMHKERMETLWFRVNYPRPKGHGFVTAQSY